MNGETYKELLKHYSRLYQMPVEELRTLALQYPYVQNLQILLQEKLILEGQGEDQTQLAKAALYSVDRGFLQKKVLRLREKKGEFALEAVRMAEDYLELRDLNSVREDLEKIALGNFDESSVPLSEQMALASRVEEEQSIFAHQEVPSIPDDDLDLEEQLEALSEAPTLSSADIESPLPYIEEVLPNANTVIPTEPLLEELEKSAPPPPLHLSPKPLPKAAFQSWQHNQDEALGQHLALLMAFQPSTQRKPNLGEDQTSKEAMKSMVDKDGIASETWAKLLVSQKQYHKAIEVYQRLMHKEPDKTVLFTEKIEEIKGMMG
jgi:tetratricopeptide (TPR) repeat protein